jgi:hypothetical protein
MSNPKDIRSGIEMLLWQEAVNDLENESQGKAASVGEMQKLDPEAYKAARELVLGMAKSFPLLALSMKQAERISEMIHSEDEGLSAIQDVLNMQPVNALTLAHLIHLERTRTAKRGADAKHNKPGGSRENQAKIRAIWAMGNFTSRDRCAEEECAALGMSYATARKALRNTPKPPSLAAASRG